MKPNTRRKHVVAKYRSGLEKQIAAFLSDVQTEVRYEKLKIEWEDLSYRTYTPDFVLDNGIIIETKGKFDADDRRKHLEIKKQHPELDIRFVFSNAKGKLYKGSKTCYSEWCEQHNFKWCHRVIPESWLHESGTAPKLERVKLKHPRKDTECTKTTTTKTARSTR
jgi:hypothetical protein